MACGSGRLEARGCGQREDGDARDGAGIEEIPQYETWTRQWAAELLSCRAAALLGQKRYRDALAQAEKALELQDAIAMKDREMSVLTSMSVAEESAAPVVAHRSPFCVLNMSEI